MRRLGFAIALLLASAAFSAAARDQLPAPPGNRIVFRGQYYGTPAGPYAPGGGVLCHVSGQKLACANSLYAVQCDDKGCTPRLGQQANFETVDDDVEVLLPQMAYLEPGRFGPGHVPMYVQAKVLRPGRFSLGPAACRLNGWALVCRLHGAAGGFQITGFGFRKVDYFLRIESYDDAPPGWPWDVKRHGPRELMPTTAFNSLSTSKWPGESDISANSADDLGDREIRVADGYYAAAGRKVVCRVVGRRVACTNGRATVECSSHICEPRRGPQTPGPPTDPSVAVTLADLNSETHWVASLPPGPMRWVLGPVTCRSRPSDFECALLVDKASFEMDHLFTRISGFHQAPENWPWGRNRTDDGFTVRGPPGSIVEP